jgi:hypothetical protein
MEHLMIDELQGLLDEAARSDWAPEVSQRLAEGIETRIVAVMSSRLRFALGSEEAAQLARLIAWERCRELAANPPTAGASWGYLANLVRWRLIDAARADWARHRRQLPLQDLPELEATNEHLLGHHLDRIAFEVATAGLSMARTRRLIRAAADGPPYFRAAIIERLKEAGAHRGQAEGFAWLLRGGAANRSALARLASGQAPSEVFSDPAVRRWVRAAAGADPLFGGGRAGVSSRRVGRWPRPIGPELARSA